MRGWTSSRYLPEYCHSRSLPSILQPFISLPGIQDCSVVSCPRCWRIRSRHTGKISECNDDIAVMMITAHGILMYKLWCSLWIVIRLFSKMCQKPDQKWPRLFDPDLDTPPDILSYIGWPLNKVLIKCYVMRWGDHQSHFCLSSLNLDQALS